MQLSRKGVLLPLADKVMCQQCGEIVQHRLDKEQAPPCGDSHLVAPTISHAAERDLIRTRTAEGRSRAQKRGQRMGRPPKLTAAQQAEARRRRAEGATLAELACSYDVGKSTISRLS